MPDSPSIMSSMTTEEFVCRECKTLFMDEEVCVNCGGKETEAVQLTAGARRAKLAWRTIRLGYKQETKRRPETKPKLFDAPLLLQKIGSLKERMGKLLCYNALILAMNILLEDKQERKKEIIALTFPGTSNQFESMLQTCAEQYGVPCTLKLVERNADVFVKQKELFKNKQNTTLFLTDLGRGEMTTVNKWDWETKKMVLATNAEIMEWLNLVWLDFMSGLSYFNLLAISHCFRFNRNNTWLFAVTYGTRHNQVTNVENTVTKTANRFNLIVNPLINIRYEGGGSVRMNFALYKMNRVVVGIAA